jgi:multisubunit Na+/H+ antiporter MnhB subunit
VVSTYFQRRRERQRKRRRFEEIVAWIVVPIIVLVTWWVGAQLYKTFEEPASRVIRELTSRGERVP